MDAFAFSLRQMLCGLADPLGSARALSFGALAGPLGSALAARAYFLLLRQKKVAKEKATPGYAVGYADSPALLKVPGGCGTRPCGPQTVLAEGPRPFSVARRSTWGPRKASRNDGSAQEQKTSFFSGRPLETAKNHLHRFGGDAFRVPLRGAEQRRLAGGFGLRLFEPQASLASRPASRVAQGTGQRPAPTRGSPFLCLLSFGEAKESETPRKGGTPTPNKNDIPRSRDQSERRNPRVKQHNIPIAIRR